MMQEFFPGGDPSTGSGQAQEPQVSGPRHKSWILNEVGLCLMNLGRLGEAAPFYARGTEMAEGLEDWHNASSSYRNLAGLHAHLGALAASADAARQSLALARRAENRDEECNALSRQANIAHLCGDIDTAGRVFRQAEALERPEGHLYSIRGIWHADHLRRAGDPAYARRVTEANLEICEQHRVVKDLSLCHRVLGDLDGDAGDHESARAHYEQALKIARAITVQFVLIEALLARGRWATRRACQTSEVWETSDVSTSAAFSDLNEALGYAVDGGYRVYEADVRVALAWAHLAVLRQAQDEALRQAQDEALRRAQGEAERALQMSEQMGYHWGQVDAAQVLAALDAHGL